MQHCCIKTNLEKSLWRNPSIAFNCEAKDVSRKQTTTCRPHRQIKNRKFHVIAKLPLNGHYLSVKGRWLPTDINGNDTKIIGYIRDLTAQGRFYCTGKIPLICNSIVQLSSKNSATTNKQDANDLKLQQGIIWDSFERNNVRNSTSSLPLFDWIKFSDNSLGESCFWPVK